MNEEAQDFEHWLLEKLAKYLTFNKLDESMIIDADPPKDHTPDNVKLIQEANTEESSRNKEHQC